MPNRPSTTNPKPKTRILIVDDHPIVRQGFAQLINDTEDLELAGEAGDAAAAMDALKKNRPDFAIVDISLKGGNGLDLTKSMLAERPDLPVLVVSMFDEGLYVERVLRAGAKGYLMKQEATEKVVAAIRRILSGELYVSEKMRDVLLQKLVTGQSPEASPLEKLSDRELEVMQLLGQGRGTRQIAETLHVSIKTVESHYAKIKEKCHLSNVNELIQYAVKWFHSDS
ncbi:MAG: response regulator transcription factor [Deltaproteobacteria bacterium]|nr:response regulator transcription factor [Deltaproteobacteria bacterium]